MIETRVVFFFQAEDGIRDLVRSRGLGDVYKRQLWATRPTAVNLHWALSRMRACLTPLAPDRREAAAWRAATGHPRGNGAPNPAVWPAGAAASPFHIIRPPGTDPATDSLLLL